MRDLLLLDHQQIACDHQFLPAGQHVLHTYEDMDVFDRDVRNLVVLEEDRTPVPRSSV